MQAGLIFVLLPVDQNVSPKWGLHHTSENHFRAVQVRLQGKEVPEGEDLCRGHSSCKWAPPKDHRWREGARKRLRVRSEPGVRRTQFGPQNFPEHNGNPIFEENCNWTAVSTPIHEIGGGKGGGEIAAKTGIPVLPNLGHIFSATVRTRSLFSILFL